jgi:hypothetical protein
MLAVLSLRRAAAAAGLAVLPATATSLSPPLRAIIAIITHILILTFFHSHHPRNRTLLVLENACFACPGNEARLLGASVQTGEPPLVATVGKRCLLCSFFRVWVPLHPLVAMPWLLSAIGDAVDAAVIVHRLLLAPCVCMLHQGTMRL